MIDCDKPQICWGYGDDSHWQPQCDSFCDDCETPGHTKELCFSIPEGQGEGPRRKRRPGNILTQVGPIIAKGEPQPADTNAQTEQSGKRPRKKKDIKQPLPPEKSIYPEIPEIPEQPVYPSLWFHFQAGGLRSIFSTEMDSCR